MVLYFHLTRFTGFGYKGARSAETRHRKGRADGIEYLRSGVSTNNSNLKLWNYYLKVWSTYSLCANTEVCVWIWDLETTAVAVEERDDVIAVAPRSLNRLARLLPDSLYISVALAITQVFFLTHFCLRHEQFFRDNLVQFNARREDVGDHASRSTFTRNSPKDATVVNSAIQWSASPPPPPMARRRPSARRDCRRSFSSRLSSVCPRRKRTS